MSEFYDIYEQLIGEYATYQAFLALLQEGPVPVKMMTLYFRTSLYMDTQPVIPPLSTINMYFNDGTTLYSDLELIDIQNIFNFFGGVNYPIGRKFKEFALYYITRFDEDLITVVNNIKIAYNF